MKFKTLFSFLLTVILCTALVNAAANFTLSPSSLNFINADNSKSFSITPTIAGLTYHFAFPTILDKDNVAIIFTPIADTLIPGTTAQTFTINSIVDYTKLNLGTTYTGNLVITDTSNSANTNTLPIIFKSSFCKYGENGTDLTITNVEINNMDGDDTEWSPLDEVEVKVEVTNEGTEKLSSVYVELGLYDITGKNKVNDLKNLNNKKIKLGSISDGDDATKTFTFIVPVEFKEENYKLVIKAYKDEKTLCTSQSSSLDNNFYQSITGARETDENKQIIVDNVQIIPSPAQCSDKVQISGDAVNIGDTDFEDQIKVTLYNKELGVNSEQVIRKDFDQGDSSPFDFDFDVPATVSEKNYDLEFRIWYDYNTDDDTYGLGSDKIIKQLVIQGNCQKTITETANARITAEPNPETPEAIAGKQFIVDANLKNIGTTEATYTVSIYGNTAWSTLNSMTPQSFTLAPGESKDISISLTIDSQAQGTQEFTIKSVYGTKTTEQKVGVPISQSQAGSQALITHLQTNWFIYLIVLINVVLIIAIIMVIRRMLSPRREEYQ